MAEQTQTPWQRVRNFIAGYCSGICLVLVGHPFDTIKVRLQTEGTSGKFKGPIHCLKETFANEAYVKYLMNPFSDPDGVITSPQFDLHAKTSLKRYVGV